MAFGKPGRPRENRLQRRSEIYRRVAPLISDRGSRLTMREAASAACLSVGGLYHYFPTKRELLLSGLRPEVQTFVCRQFEQRHAETRASNPRRYLDAFLDHQVEMALFIRPSVRVATEMGLATLSVSIESTVRHAAAEFGELIAEFVPGAGDSELEALARGVRRSIVGALFDPSVGREELKDNLRALIDGAALSVERDGRPHAPSGRAAAQPPRVPA